MYFVDNIYMNINIVYTLCITIHIITCVQALLLTAYMKLAVAHPNDAALKQSVESVFARYARQASLEPLIISFGGI